METAITTAIRRNSPSQTSVEATVFPREADVTDIRSSIAERHSASIEHWKETDGLIFDVFATEAEREVLESVEDIQTQYLTKHRQLA
jgi:predicted lipoprotein